MRDVNLLHPELQRLVKIFLERCKAEGLDILITQTWRTKKEQDDLFYSGKGVTGLKYPYSLHC